MIAKIGTSPVFQAANTGAHVAAKELGPQYQTEIIIDWQSPQNSENVKEQAATIEKFIRARVDAIAIACTDAEYLTPYIDKAVAQGIPVLCFDSDAPTSKRFAYYGANDIEFGKAMMKELATQLGGKGTIAVLAGNPKAFNQQQRLHGLKDELARYPGILLLPKNEFHNEETPQKAIEVLSRAYTANRSIKGWALFGSWAVTLKKSLPWSPGEVKAVCLQAVPNALIYVESGHIQVLVSVNCFKLGYESVKIIADKVLRNQSPPQPLLYTPISVINKNTLSEWQLNWRKWLVKEAAYR
ncbi:MAG: substrate-binding domain-containing protein [bacterium]